LTHSPMRVCTDILCTVIDARGHARTGYDRRHTANGLRTGHTPSARLWSMADLFRSLPCVWLYERLVLCRRFVRAVVCVIRVYKGPAFLIHACRDSEIWGRSVFDIIKNGHIDFFIDRTHSLFRESFHWYMRLFRSPTIDDDSPYTVDLSVFFEQNIFVLMSQNEPIGAARASGYRVFRLHH